VIFKGGVFFIPCVYFKEGVFIPCDYSKDDGNPSKELQHGPMERPNLISLFCKIVDMFFQALCLGQVEYLLFGHCILAP